MRKVIAILGESGSGKTSIFNVLVNDYNFIPICETTDRNMRPNEKQGNPYWFKTKQEFKQLSQQGKLIGETGFYTFNTGLLSYAVNKDTIPKKGLCAIQANWQSLEELEQYFGDELISVQISRNDKDKIISLLNREALPNVFEICERFLRDKERYDKLETDYVVYNNDIRYTANHIYNIVKGDYFE